MPGKKTFSPLRYPGGKACLSNFITEMVCANQLNGGVYLELYAGGAGAALSMLFDGTFQRIHINDYDYHIYCMWESIINDHESFIEKIESTEVTIDEWHRQKNIYNLGRDVMPLDLGFATFFLNRTNRSGIIYKAGPIGGINQTGNYKIDVRFNKTDLIDRIKKIASYRDQILLTNLDAVDIINNLRIHHPDTERLFLYLDPPYYKKGKFLYLNNYAHSNHKILAEAVAELVGVKWLISYDNVPEIREIYKDYRMSTFDLNYTLQSKKFGKELLVFADSLQLGPTITVNSRQNELVLL